MVSFRAMSNRLSDISLEKISFTGASDNTIAGDIAIPHEKTGLPPVILLHGGGQTRHSWRGTARLLAARGFTCLVYDQRGHGDSSWIEDGDYSFDAFAGDLKAAAQLMQKRTGHAPAIVGASLGGMAGMLAVAQGPPEAYASLVLVDITPNMKLEGVEKVLGIMGERATSGFASLEEAADAIARYLPHRPRPSSLSGLAKNLRRDSDGRYRWHWDPKFLDQRHEIDEHRKAIESRMTAAAQTIKIPVLLVRGRDSELVGTEQVNAFLQLVPHAETADVSGARHMVAGDRNDVFCNAVTAFLERNHKDTA